MDSSSRPVMEFVPELLTPNWFRGAIITLKQYIYDDCDAPSWYVTPRSMAK